MTHTSMSRRACLRQALVRLPLLLGAAPLAGCSLGAATRLDFHMLRDPGADGAAAAATAASAPRIDQVLLVASGVMPGLYDSDRMVFSADGRSRSYFQFGYWSERPAQSLLLLAEARLARAQRFRDVVLSTSGVRGDLLLTLRLDELYLDDTQQQARVVFTAELVDWRQRGLLARRTFTGSLAVASRSASGLAEATSQVMSGLLDELVIWAASSAVSRTAANAAYRANRANRA